MNWQVVAHNKTRKQLKRFSKKDIARIMAALDQFEINPFFGDIEKMEGEKNVWRKRVGSYRISFEIYMDKRIVFVFDIKRRTTTTYRHR